MYSIISKINEYLDEYGKYYTSGELSYIKHHILRSIRQYPQCDIINQIIELLGLVSDEKNVHRGFLDLVKKYHSLDQDILEVGSGYYPILSTYISEEQNKLGKGTITAMDPSSIKEDIPGIKVLKKSFSLQTDINPYKLILAYMPCEATIPLVKKANTSHKPFSIALCGCVHDFRSCFSEPTSEMYQDYVIDIANSTLEEDAEIVIDRLPERYIIDLPILTKRYK